MKNSYKVFAFCTFIIAMGLIFASKNMNEFQLGFRIISGFLMILGAFVILWSRKNA
jgi:hypothetical protein